MKLYSIAQIAAMTGKDVSWLHKIKGELIQKGFAQMVGKSPVFIGDGAVEYIKTRPEKRGRKRKEEN